MKNSQSSEVLYKKNPKQCPTCNGKIPYKKRNNKYCGQPCAAKKNKNRQGTGRSFPQCKKCGKPVQRHQNTFCNSCIFLGEHLHRIRNSNDCLSEQGLRSYLLRTRPLQCSSCKRKTWKKQSIPLEVDHKDGDATNNKENNVRLICPNCHAQCPTSKGKNRGNGRKKRREWRKNQKEKPSF